VVRAGAFSTQAIVALKRGQGAEALALAERGLEAVSSGTKPLSTESTLRLIAAEALHALNRTQEAHVAIRAARDRILGIAATLAHRPELRESYLTRIEANARTLRLASEWLGLEPGE
jgi:hypothetical protein